MKTAWVEREALDLRDLTLTTAEPVEESREARPARSPVKGHIKELDGLRAIAVLLVLIHHSWPISGPFTCVAKLVHLGWIGVDLFFVISGFLIGGILLDTVGDRHYFRNFYTRRSLRLFPLYYLFLIFTFALFPILQPGAYAKYMSNAGSPVWYFLYLGNLRSALTGAHAPLFLAPLWSLCIEEQFYLSYPWLVRSLSRDRLQKLLVTLVCVAPLFRLVTYLAFPVNEKIQYLATFSRLDVVALGCLLALVLRSPGVTYRKGHVLGAMVAMMGVLALTFALGGFNRQGGFCRVIGFSLPGMAFALLLLWTVLNRGERCTSWLRTRPLGYLGTICYGTYLLQALVTGILATIYPRLGLTWDRGSIWLTLAQCIGTVMLASASWFLFEKQVLKLKDRFASRSHPTGT